MTIISQSQSLPNSAFNKLQVHFKQDSMDCSDDLFFKVVAHFYFSRMISQVENKIQTHSNELHMHRGAEFEQLSCLFNAYMDKMSKNVLYPFFARFFKYDMTCVLLDFLEDSHATNFDLIERVVLLSLSEASDKKNTHSADDT